MASIALVEGSAEGSNQHSSFAQGFVFTTSGGSTPILRHMNKPALKVFNRDFSRQGTAEDAQSASASPFELQANLVELTVILFGFPLSFPAPVSLRREIL